MARERIPPPLQPLLFQPVESHTGFNFAAVLDEARAVWFPELEDDVEVRIGAYGPLAFVVRGLMGPRRHVVVFHPVLNLPGVPEEVVRFIAKHELTHIVRPPIDFEAHHAWFWEHEYAVGRERWAAWSWIHRYLGPALYENHRGVGVYSTWRKRMAGRKLGPYTPHLPIDDVPWEQLCPEGGAQLRLPPPWAWRPLLASPVATRAGTLSGDATPAGY